MEWKELAVSEYYLQGQIFCVNPTFALSLNQIRAQKDSVRRFRATISVGVIGPIESFTHDEEQRLFVVRWKWLNIVESDLSIGATIGIGKGADVPNSVTLSTNEKVVQFENRVLYLGLDQETDMAVYLHPDGFELKKKRVEKDIQEESSQIFPRQSEDEADGEPWFSIAGILCYASIVLFYFGCVAILVPPRSSTLLVLGAMVFMAFLMCQNTYVAKRNEARAKRSRRR